MYVKAGVNLAALTPRMALVLMVAERVFLMHGHEPTLTENSSDGAPHREHSRHFIGDAVDLRTNDINPTTAASIAASMQERLGSDFDVVNENPDDPVNCHLHVEFDPFRRS